MDPYHNRCCIQSISASSHHLELSWPPLICSLVMMFCCVIGLPGNLISAAIFSRLTSRSPINVLLLSLSVIDFCLLLFSAPIMVVPSLNVYLNSSWVAQAYPYALVVCYPMSLIIQSCSMYTFVLISLERYMAVCKIFQLRKWCTTSRTKWAQCLVVVFSVVSNLVRFWEYVLDDDEKEGYRRLLRDDYIYFTCYHLVLHLITQFILPFSLIGFLGANILRTMAETGADTAKNSTGLSRRQASQRRTTIMICVVTAMFVICNTLPFLINVWEVIDFRLFYGPYSPVAYPLVDVANALVFLNSSTTFVFYWAFCQKYRVVLRSGVWWIMECFYRVKIRGTATSSASTPLSDLGYNPLAPSSCSRLLAVTSPSRRSSVAVPGRPNLNRLGREECVLASNYILMSRVSMDLSAVHG